MPARAHPPHGRCWVARSITYAAELAVRDGALQKLWKVQGTNRRYFIGAYAGGGIPLLEGCVDSGLRVGKMFGVDENLVYRVAKVRPRGGCFGGVSSHGAHTRACWSCFCARRDGQGPDGETAPAVLSIYHGNQWQSSWWVQALLTVRQSLQFLFDRVF